MKVRENFLLRKVAGSWLVMPIGQEMLDFNGILTLNETGAFLWKKLQEGASVEELATALIGEYKVSLEEARTDVKEFCDGLIEKGCLLP